MVTKGLVQGWDLATHALLQHTSNVAFTAAKTFLNDVHITDALTSGSPTRGCSNFPIGNLTVEGKVSDVSCKSSFFGSLVGSKRSNQIKLI